MSELAAQLVDRVIPQVPVRQWVLSLPFGLRYQLAFDATLTAAVLDVFIRSVFAGLRRAAVRAGIADPQCGAITAIQRFGCRHSYCDLLHEHSLGRPPSCGSPLGDAPAVSRLLVSAQRIERSALGRTPRRHINARPDPSGQRVDLVSAELRPPAERRLTEARVVVQGVHGVDDVADARPGVEPSPDHPPLGDGRGQEGADEGGGEEGPARFAHWMISSARASTAGGMMSPSDFAV